jgi:adenylosuccinate synthase
MPGWPGPTLGTTAYDALPLAARNYLERLEKILAVPVDIVSTGPSRDAVILRRHPFD